MPDPRQPLLTKGACFTRSIKTNMHTGVPMIELHPNYLVDGQTQRKAVVLSIEEWSQVLEALEELDDIRVYDEAKARQDQAVPLEKILQNS